MKLRQISIVAAACCMPRTAVGSEGGRHLRGLRCTFIARVEMSGHLRHSSQQLPEAHKYTPCLFNEARNCQCPRQPRIYESGTMEDCLLVHRLFVWLVEGTTWAGRETLAAELAANACFADNKALSKAAVPRNRVSNSCKETSVTERTTVF